MYIAFLHRCKWSKGFTSSFKIKDYEKEFYKHQADHEDSLPRLYVLP